MRVRLDIKTAQGREDAERALGTQWGGQRLHDDCNIIRGQNFGSFRGPCNVRTRAYAFFLFWLRHMAAQVRQQTISPSNLFLDERHCEKETDSNVSILIILIILII